LLVGYLLCVLSTAQQYLILIDDLKVAEDPGELGKKGFVNFKCVVWHRTFYEILDSIRLLGKVGHRLSCGDSITRWLFPLLLILSSDYEEQYDFKFLITIITDTTSSAGV
jgi:hypothetical protein